MSPAAMKTRSQSSPKRKKAKVSLSPAAPFHEASDDIENLVDEYRNRSAKRYRVCTKIAGKIDSTRGVRVHCTRYEMRQRVRHIERRFVRAHAWSITDAGTGLLLKNLEAFTKTVEKMCPFYFKLFPALIYFIDELKEEIDDDDLSVESCDEAASLNGIHEKGGAYGFDEYADNPSTMAQIEKSHAKLDEFRGLLYSHYLRMKASGVSDRKIFQRFPQFVVAEFPKR
jgi:hypothetical protein